MLRVNTLIGFGAGGEEGTTPVKGLLWGGFNASYLTQMDSITIATMGDATNIGNLTTGRGFAGSCGTSNRCVAFGGSATGGRVASI